jgi:hypothetical protein
MARLGRIPKNLRDTAYHEAGHAVAMLELGIAPGGTTIKPTDDELGATYRRKERVPLVRLPGIEPTRCQIARTNREMKIALAGPLAEWWHRSYRDDLAGFDFIQYAGSDLSRVNILKRVRYANQDDQNLYVARMTGRTLGLLQKPVVWAQVVFLADAMLTIKPTIDGDNVRNLCAHARQLCLRSTSS